MRMEVIPRKAAPAPFLSIKDAATVTGLSQFYLRAGCKDGSVPHIMCGNQYRINVPKLIEKLNQMSLKTEGESV